MIKHGRRNLLCMHSTAYTAPTTDSAREVIVKHLMTKHYAQVKSDTRETINKFDTFFSFDHLISIEKKSDWYSNH